MGKHEMPEDETKKKFREALERKNSKSAAGSAHTDSGPKPPKAQGPVDGRREFRRKSG
ncbi:DUF5302 domain-containing protein [[Mycobacterium] burgundiense]|jgi:hypothetical protein|uniref:DUF5302 domain-containing protein n=1 Tax=[Mycobacterium] burgundiense TaxID=3064286 RepID=A0ABM9LFG3_9MYCO|nr:DUF5302 domain-containing protein [Mycolicibacterium sp. MU0053]CAJ1498149.1 DUF5302 domain-containing protein [Mycolicibacterium sp. MU0053]